MQENCKYLWIISIIYVKSPIISRIKTGLATNPQTVRLHIKLEQLVVGHKMFKTILKIYCISNYTEIKKLLFLGSVFLV